MKTAQIGHCYLAKLSKGQTLVRVESKHPDGGWVAKAILTGRIARIKTPDQLIRESTKAEIEEATFKRGPLLPKVIAGGPIKKGRKPSRRIEVIEEPDFNESQPETVETQPAAAPQTETHNIYDQFRQNKKKPMSLLNAAYQVLKEYGSDLSIGEIIQAIKAKGYWSSDGQTPVNTLNAAIAHEMKKKGLQSRFEKIERGRYRTRL